MSTVGARESSALPSFPDGKNGEKEKRDRRPPGALTEEGREATSATHDQLVTLQQGIAGQKQEASIPEKEVVRDPKEERAHAMLKQGREMLEKAFEALDAGKDEDGKKLLESAAELCRESLKMHEDAEGFHLLAGALVNLGQHEQAEQAYGEAIRINGDMIGSIMERGRVRETLGKKEDARQDFLHAADLYTKRMEKQKASDPRDELAMAVLYRKRGLAYHFAHDSQRAVADLSRYIESPAPKNEKTNAYFNRGVGYYELGMYDRALQDLAEAIAANPGDIDAQSWKGHCYFKLGDLKKAIACYREVLRLNPQHASGRENMIAAYEEEAEQLLRREQYAEMLLVLPELLTLDPQNAAGRKMAAIAMMMTGKIADAEKVAAEVLKSEPNDGIMWMVRAEHCLSIGQHDEAVQLSEKASALDEGNVDILELLGRAYVARGKEGDAEKAFSAFVESMSLCIGAGMDEKGLRAADQALRIKPGAPKVRHDRALLLFLTKKQGEAERIFTDLEKEILEAHRQGGDAGRDEYPSNFLGMVYFNRARIRRDQGNTEEAYDDLKLAETHSDGEHRNIALLQRSFLMATMWREPFFNPQEANAIARELCGLNVRSDVGPVMVHRSHAYLSCLAVSFGALGGEERALMEKALKSGNAPKAQEHENKAAAHFAQAERWIRQALESAPESRQELYGEMLQHFLHQKAYTEEVSPAQYAPEVRVA